MNLVDVLRQAQNGRAFDNLARTFGVTPAQAEAVVRAVLPQLSAGMERNTLSRGGLADLVNALGQGHESVLDQPAAIGDPSVRDDGNAILGHILGTKDRSRAIADKAALSSGVSASLIKLMLPFIASMLMGGLSKVVKGGLGDILGKMGGLPGGAPSGGGMRMPEMPRLPDMPEMPRMPDSGGGPFGGNPTGNGGLQLPPLTPAGGNMGGSPLPLPGDIPGLPNGGQNPYGDLSDILRRGGGLPTGGGAGPAGGGVLWSIVRGILGSALGFQSKGLMGWLFRAVFARFGWAILRAVFGRMLGAR